MRLKLEGFWISDYIEAVLNYIEMGTFLTENPWQSKEQLLNKLKSYDFHEQQSVYLEIKNFISKINLEFLLNHKPVEGRIIEFIDNFDLDVIKSGEKKYSYDIDLQLVINYIKKDIDFSETLYSSKENFFTKLRQSDSDRQQAMICEIKTEFSEKFRGSFSGYLLSFIVAPPRDPIEQRAKEVLAAFDPQNLKLVLEELARDGTSQRCYVM